MRKEIIECDRCGFSEKHIQPSNKEKHIQPSNNFVEVAEYELLDNTHDKDIDYFCAIDLNVGFSIDAQTKFLCKNCQKIFIKMCRELIIYFNNTFENFWAKSNIVNVKKDIVIKNKSRRSLIIRR